jgi:predicted ATP-grasp superfamily ATP-dependent carboligase
MYESDQPLVEFLKNLKNKYPGDKVLIPASDDCSLFLARHEHELSSEFSVLNPSAKTMESLKDKRLQYELATSVGVPIPETYFPESQQEVDILSESICDYPYIIKPLEAQKWRLADYAGVSQGKKAITVMNAQELREEYSRIAKSDKAVMVQEIIPGRDENLFTFLGYCSRNHRLVAHCVRYKLRQMPIDFGYCTSTVSCHNDTVERYAARMLERVGYHGIVGIEFKFDFRTETYKLIEINTRPVNTIGLSVGCGINLPKIAYCDAVGIEQQDRQDWHDGVIWIRLRQDFAAARELRKRGEMTFPQWLKSIRGKRVHAIYALDDLRPFFVYYRPYLRQQLAKVFSLPAVSYVIKRVRRTLSWLTARSLRDSG